MDPGSLKKDPTGDSQEGESRRLNKYLFYFKGSVF